MACESCTELIKELKDTTEERERLARAVEEVLALGVSWGATEPENAWAHGYRDAVLDIDAIINRHLTQES